MSANGSKEIGTVIVPQAGTVARQEFGAQQVAATGETASTAMAEQARAAVQARYVMALQKPRDLMQVRVRLLKDCGRPAFADAAIYHKPVGKGIEGPSIRLAEAAARAMTNVYSSVTALYDDPKRRIIRVSATDLESNLTFDKDVTVHKTLERSKLKPGQSAIRTRLNSNNQPVFLVEAETDDDILNTENALASKALRVCLLRLIPGDILDEAIREAYATLEKGIKDDPDKALKSICDWYDMQLGITPMQLAAYLGHPVDQTTIAEIAQLKKLFSTLKDGETTWAEVMESKTAASAAPAAGTEPAKKGQANLTDVAAASKAKREAEGPKSEQQTLTAAEAARQVDEEDADAADRAAAAPTPEEMAAHAQEPGQRPRRR
jgi:hypothetical protein